MKSKIFLSSLAAVLLATSVSPSFARLRDHREHVIRDNVRTEEAIKRDPDLSRREYKNLMKRNRKVQEQEKKYAGRHGGRLKKREVRKLQDAQDEVNYDLKRGGDDRDHDRDRDIDRDYDSRRDHND